MEQGATDIKRILQAANHFDMLKLPRPHADLMDRPVWTVTPEVVQKAFRKLSLCCHPDKSTHPDAPRAFEALKGAKACLATSLDRDDYLLEFVRQQKTRWEGNWTSAEGVSETKQRVSSMREEAQRAQHDDVVEAMRERRERAEAAARKKVRLQTARAQRRASASDDDGDDDDEEDRRARGVGSGAGPSSTSGRSAGGTMPRRPVVGAGAARKRPKFL